LYACSLASVSLIYEAGVDVDTFMILGLYTPSILAMLISLAFYTRHRVRASLYSAATALALTVAATIAVVRYPQVAEAMKPLAPAALASPILALLLSGK